MDLRQIHSEDVFGSLTRMSLNVKVKVVRDKTNNCWVIPTDNA